MVYERTFDTFAHIRSFQFTRIALQKKRKTFGKDIHLLYMYINFVSIENFKQNFLLFFMFVSLSQQDAIEREQMHELCTKCTYISKSRRSHNKLRKLQIRKFADVNNLLVLRTFSKCGTLQICNLRTQSFFPFADSKLSQVPKYLHFLLTHTFYNTILKNGLNRRLLTLFRTNFKKCIE